jgi:hypothetical protein
MRSFLITFCIIWALEGTSQVAVNVDGSVADASAMLDVKSISRGFLAPRLSLAQRNALTNPATGLMIYQTDNSPGYYFNTGTPASPDWRLFGYNAGTFSQWSNNGSNIYFNTGNVGIGTSAPSAKLHVESAAYISYLLGASQAVYGGHSISGSYGWLGASNEGAYGYSPNGYGLRGMSTNGYGIYGLHGSGNEGWIGAPNEGVYGNSAAGYGVKGNTADGYAIHGTASGSGFGGYFTGKTYINGNLGINETNPNRALYVSQLVSGLSYPLKVENKHSVLAEAAVGILFSTGGSGTNDRGKGAIAYQYTNTWNRGAFLFLQNSEANANNPVINNVVMAITNAGNVGIGYHDPGARLEVASNSGPTLIIKDLNGGGDRPGIQFINNSSHFFSADDYSEELFGFYSKFDRYRTYNAKLAVYGSGMDTWGNYIGLTHDGTDGVIDTDAGDIKLAPSGDVIVDADLNVNNSLNVNGSAFISNNITTTTKTSSIIIPPAAFECSTNDETIDSYYNAGFYLSAEPSSGSVQFYAPLYIPDDKYITEMEAFYIDNSATENITLKLYRYAFYTGTTYLIAEQNTSWDHGTRLSLITSLNYQINTESNFYYFLLSLKDDQTFYGVKITYTYNAIRN